MLISDPKIIGDKLLKIRKEKNLSQEETAWRAGISPRAYASIERGETQTRVETFVRICEVFSITPDDILAEDKKASPQGNPVEMLNKLNDTERETALQLLNVYIRSIVDPSK